MSNNRNIYSRRSTDGNLTGQWQDGMVAGNGKIGVVCNCSPYHESDTFQNMDFVMPTPQPRFTPKEVSEQLEEARQAVIKLDDTWDIHNRKRTQMYIFHPGGRMSITMEEEQLIDYSCFSDNNTGEINVKYQDKYGKWMRKIFVSRKDDIAVTMLRQSDEGKAVSAIFSMDDIITLPRYGKNKIGITSECDMSYEIFADEKTRCIGLIAHYPDFDGSELKNSGYITISSLYVSGQRATIQKKMVSDGIVGLEVENAEEIIVLTKTDCLTELGEIGKFSQQVKRQVEDEYVKKLNQIADRYRNHVGQLEYEALLKPHEKLHREMFQAVSLALGKSEGESSEQRMSNEELLKKQKNSDTLSDELVTRVYAQGREALIECSGYSIPRLCGLWTGEWNPGWNGAYTMDANVNIQVSGMNTGHIYEAAVGYIYFIMNQIPDWEENAALVYGMKDAILIPVNTDGLRAMMVEYDKRYLFQYWNAGASWMMVPLYEFWQCYGNQKIPVNSHLKTLYHRDVLDLEGDILRPLLHKTMHFWMQLCTPEYYTDITGKPCYEKGKQKLLSGEHYMLVPGYSPENIPKDYNSTVTANTAMDISAARDSLNMVMSLEKKSPDSSSSEIIAQCMELMERLPEYEFDETGALREWSYPYFKDNNEHRHISHLYCAWPAYETQKNMKLREACKIAIENRNRENQGIDDTASHGWIHKALVAARLKDSECVEEILQMLFYSDIFYNSLMTDHNTNRQKDVYCTDTIIGLVGVINEMLIYSNDGVIELLPALISSWRCGKITGIMTRTRACVEQLKWDINKEIVSAVIVSYEAQEIQITCACTKNSIITSMGKRIKSGEKISFQKDERIVVEFTG